MKITRAGLLTAVYLALPMLLWASAFTAIRVGLTGYAPVELAFLRYLFASAVLILVALVTRMPLPQVRDIPFLFVCGAIGFGLYSGALNAGEQSVSPGTASFIISSEVGVIAVLAAVFLRERLPRLGWIGVVLCIAGVALISLTADGGFELSVGALLVFVATLSISVFTVIQKPLLRRYSSLQFTTYAIWGGAISLFFFSPNAFTQLASAPTDATIAVLYMGIFPGIIAYWSWSQALKRMDVARAGSFLALVPIAALAIAWLFLGDVPPLMALLGGAIVLVGVLLVNRRG
ncbi:MAG: DMT family transporter [Pleurocapsa minor GSE-CHR-MK-17-07R]|nr:DMT family transporter [Pleurocapsa minor GSE-CHR-MK 17-07R]